MNLPCAIHFQETLGQPTSESLVSGRMDWNIRTSDRALFLLQYDNGRQPIVVDPISSLFNVYETGPWWEAQLNETHTFGTTAANQFLVAGVYKDDVSSLVNPMQRWLPFRPPWIGQMRVIRLRRWEDLTISMAIPSSQGSRSTASPTIS